MPNLTPDLVQPVAPPSAPLTNVSPTQDPTAIAAPAAPAPKKSKAKTPELPKAIKNSPAVKDVLQGKIPGVMVRPGLYYPKAWEIAEHHKELMEIGLDFFFPLDESVILFNPVKITEEELKSAMQQGKLSQILPDYETLTGERPVAPPEGVQVGFGTLAPEAAAELAAGQPGAPVPPPVAAGPLPPSDVEQKLTTQRLRNLNVVDAGPTSGPVPGAGRVINAAAVPAV